MIGVRPIVKNQTVANVAMQPRRTCIRHKSPLSSPTAAQNGLAMLSAATKTKFSLMLAPVHTSPERTSGATDSWTSVQYSFWGVAIRAKV